MSTTKIYLDLSDELEQLLSDNRINIAEVLAQQNIEAEIKYGTMPVEAEQGARAKDVVLIILASSAAIIAIGTAISQVISTLQRKPHIVECEEFVEVTDAHGKLQIKPVKRYELLEPREEDINRTFEFGFSSERGFVLKFSSAEKQMGTIDTLPANNGHSPNT